MSALGFAILLGLGGTFLGALWTFVVGLGGGPSAMLTHLAMKRSQTNVIPMWGLLLTVASQLYVALCFVAFIVLTTRGHLAGQSGFGTWVAWLVAFVVASVPSMAALKDSGGAERRNVQHLATTFTAPLAAIGFFVFAFAPGAINPLWAWVPRSCCYRSAVAGKGSIDRSTRVALDSSPQADSIRSVLVTMSEIQTDLLSQPSSPEDTTRLIQALEAKLQDIEPVSTDALDWAYPGWGTQVKTQWLPSMRMVISHWKGEGPKEAESIRKTMNQMAAYDSWLVSQRLLFFKELKRKRIIEAYTDSAGTVH